MEIKLTKTKIDRIKRDYERFYEQKEYHVSELDKYINYPSYAEGSALTYIKNDAKIEAVHNFLLILGLDLYYDWKTKEAHITDMEGNEITGE